jgi:hypothetical protein
VAFDLEHDGVLKRREQLKLRVYEFRGSVS